MYSDTTTILYIFDYPFKNLDRLCTSLFGHYKQDGCTEFFTERVEKYCHTKANCEGGLNDIEESIRLMDEQGMLAVTIIDYVSDAETYIAFTTNTIELASELNDKAIEIAGNIRDEEVLELHRVYMNYSNKFLSALKLMISAIKIKICHKCQKQMKS